MRTWNSILNSSFAAVSQFIILIFAFITRTVFIRILGPEYLGFDSLFTNVLSVLSIVDLGLGTALNFSLYKPIYEEDIEKVSAIIHYFKKTFTIMGVSLLLLSLCVTPFIGNLVNGSDNSIPYMQKVFLLYAILTFSSYFFTDVRTIFYAHQKNYKVLMFDFITKIFTKVLQVILLYIHPSYLWYLGIEILITCSLNVRLMIKAHNEYSDIFNCRSKLNKDDKKRIFTDVKYLSISKIAAVGIGSTDSLIISKFIGTAVLGLYSNYFLILGSVQGLLASLLNGVVASLGNLFAEDESKKINRVFEQYNFISIQIATFFSIGMLVLLQPFITIWLGKAYLLEYSIIIVLTFNCYLGLISASINNVIIAKGLFKQELPIRILQVLINLSVSIALVIKLGLIGVFIGTTISSVISFILSIYMVVKAELKLDLNLFIKDEIKYLIISLIQLVFLSALLNHILIESSIIYFVLKLLMIFIFFILSEVLIYRNNNNMKAYMDIILNFMKKSIRKS